MKFSLLGSDLIAALEAVRSAVDPAHAKSADNNSYISDVTGSYEFGCIQMIADKERQRITCVATDGQTVVMQSAAAKVDTTGDVLIPAKSVSRKMLQPVAKGQVQVTLGQKTNATPQGVLRLAQDQVRLNVTLSAGVAEFPPVPTLPSKKPVQIYASRALKSALERVSLFAADSDARPVLQAVNFKENELAAIDGFTLSTVHLDSKGFTGIVPLLAIRCLIELLPANGDVAVRVYLQRIDAKHSFAHFVIDGSGSVVGATLLDDSFPEYEHLFPKAIQHKITIAGLDWIADALYPWIADKKSSISMEFARGKMTLSDPGDPGSNSVSFPCGYKAEENFTVGIRPAYLGNALGVFSGSCAVHLASGTMSPITFVPANGNGAKVLVMPMRLDKVPVSDQTVGKKINLEAWCDADALKAALADMGKIIRKKSNLPILNHVMISADGERERIVLIATNLETHLIKVIPAQVTQGGSQTAEFKTLCQIVKKQKGEVRLIGRDDSMLIEGVGRNRVGSFEATAFPALPDLGRQLLYLEEAVLTRSHRAKLSALAVMEAIHRVLPFVTPEKYLHASSPLRGVLWYTENGNGFLAAQSHIVARGLIVSLNGEIGRWVITASSVEQLKILLRGKDEVDIYTFTEPMGDEHGPIQIAFATDDGWLVTRTMENAEKFPLPSAHHPDSWEFIAHDVDFALLRDALQIMLTNNPKVESRLEYLPSEIRVSGGDVTKVVGYSCLTGEAHDVWVDAGSLASALAQEDRRGDLRFGRRPLPLISLGDKEYHVREHVLSVSSKKAAHTMWALSQAGGPRLATKEEVEAYKKKTEIKTRSISD